jgi:hypothetical protein
VVGALVVGLLFAQAVPVEVYAEGSPSCPRSDRVAALLADRGAAAAVEAAPTPWRLRYRTQPAGGALEMELVDPSGRVAARRQMQVRPSECEAGAVAMVAVVDRFFRGVAWTSGAALPTVAASPPAPPSPSRLELALGVSAALWLADSVRPRVAIALHITPSTLPARFGAHFVLPPGERIERLGGAATASETIWPLRLSAALGGRAGPGSLWIGPDALFTMGFGRGAGLPSLDSGTRITLALGGAATLQVPVGSWRIVLDLAAHRHAAGRTFHVDATDGGRVPVLESPRWQGMTGIGVARTF